MYVGEKTLDTLHTALVEDFNSLYEDGLSVLKLHASILGPGLEFQHPFS